MADASLQSMLNGVLDALSDEQLALLLEGQLSKRSEKFSRNLERVSVQRIVRNGFSVHGGGSGSGSGAKEEHSGRDADANEPLLVDRDDANISKRYVLFPIDPEYLPVYEMYKKAIACFWTVEEIDTKDDLVHWEEQLTPAERGYLSMVLAFFAASDGIVTENLAARFLSEVKSAEVRAFYSVQIGMEAIHSEVYSMLLDTYIRSSEERDRLFSAMATIGSIQRKAAWSRRWIESEQTCFAERLVAFAAVEGVFFSSSFCAIFWLKKRGLMPGLCFSNELISRDEGMHCDFACLLYTTLLQHRLSRERVLEIVTEAVECEIEFVEESLPRNLHGMNASAMATYVRFVADRLLRALGLESHYCVANPFDFMDMIGMPGKTNFFEKVVSAYQKNGVMAGARRRILASSSASDESLSSLSLSPSSPSPSTTFPSPPSSTSPGPRWPGKSALVVTDDLNF
jgi:ribonucleotide reductase beta subunit family protein with ferritin-like domain